MNFLQENLLMYNLMKVSVILINQSFRHFELASYQHIHVIEFLSWWHNPTFRTLLSKFASDNLN